MKKTLILIGIGGNLPTRDGDVPLQTCQAALRRLSALPCMRLRAVSRWYGSAPLPAGDQPPYINAVALFESVADSTPDGMALLAQLQAIEQEFGRVRSVANAARTLDLDVLAIGDAIFATPALILPHPRLPERRFVLQPLLDVWPDWRHPVSGRTVTDMLAAVAAQVLWFHAVAGAKSAIAN